MVFNNVLRRNIENEAVAHSNFGPHDCFTRICAEPLSAANNSVRHSQRYGDNLDLMCIFIESQCSIIVHMWFDMHAKETLVQ